VLGNSSTRFPPVSIEFAVPTDSKGILFYIYYTLEGDINWENLKFFPGGNPEPDESREGNYIRGKE
jgi:hypothetical protein